MIAFRPAEPPDAEAIADLHARSWRENYRGAFSDAFLDGDLRGERLRVWRGRFDDPPCNQFVQVAVNGGHDPEWGSFVDNLHVADEFKRKGVGATLMRQTGAWLGPRYADLEIYLLVLEANATARRFYERLGARNESTSTMETHGGAVVRSCRYTWPRPDVLATA